MADSLTNTEKAIENEAKASREGEFLSWKLANRKNDVRIKKISMPWGLPYVVTDKNMGLIEKIRAEYRDIILLFNNSIKGKYKSFGKYLFIFSLSPNKNNARNRCLLLYLLSLNES